MKPIRRRPTYKVIQVPIDDALLTRLDAAAGQVAESRAAYIREACQRRLRSEEASALDKRYIAGYRRKPEDPAWSKAGAKLLAGRLKRSPACLLLPSPFLAQGGGM
jgi:hypothetical protein